VPERNVDEDRPQRRLLCLRWFAMQRGKSQDRLERQDSVAQGGVLLVRSQTVFGVCDPARRETHEPFHERRCRPRTAIFVQDRGGRGGSFGDVLPSGDGVGVSPPAVKMVWIRANRVSDSFQLAGEPCGPCRARSIHLVAQGDCAPPRPHLVQGFAAA
jgi:hypothetical protein